MAFFGEVSTICDWDHRLDDPPFSPGGLSPHPA